MDGMDSFEPARSDVGDLARALELLQSLCSPLVICLIQAEKLFNIL